MSTTTTYTCDRCKKSSVGKNEIGLQGIGVVWGHHRTTDYAERGAEWCRACRILFGVEYPTNQPAAPVQDPPPTLEDLIHEIVQQKIGDAS